MRILIVLKVPQWLLRMILSYLMNRKMILRFRNCCSHPKCMSGGCPQGTLIGVILYILYINPVGYPGEITLQISDILHNYWITLGNIPDLLPTSHSLPQNMNSAKYMDDASVQESVDLTTSLATKIDRSGPLPYWESSGKVLPNENTCMQSEINNIKQLSDAREMVLNPDKTKLMIINFTHNHQFQSQLSIPQSSSKIELCFETKLLGYWLTVDMKPARHVQHILKTCYSRLWAISRLKSAGVSDDDIFYFYSMKIRTVLEFAAPVFSSMLTERDKDDIERIQKIVLKVILSDDYSSYSQACSKMNTTTLENRRKNLSLRFALSCFENPQHKHMFKQRNAPYYNIRNLKSFEEPQCHSDRYFSSPLPYLTRLLNEYFKKKPANTNK